jgi:hypothetical protein
VAVGHEQRHASSAEALDLPDEPVLNGVLEGAAGRPTLIVLGDSHGIRLEHAVELVRLRGGGVMGDLAGLPESQLGGLPGTAHFVPPGFGLLDRVEWLLAMIPPFLDATPPEDS